MYSDKFDNLGKFSSQINTGRFGILIIGVEKVGLKDPMCQEFNFQLKHFYLRIFIL